MRLAVLADIHGNLHALQTVLADMKRQGDFDYDLVPGRPGRAGRGAA